MLRLATLVVAAVMLMACGSDPTITVETARQSDTACQAIFNALALSPARKADADQQQLCQPQALTFSDELSGTVTTAYLRDSGKPCETPHYGDSWSLPALYFALGGKAFFISLGMPDVYRDEHSVTHDLSSTSVDELSGGSWHWQGRTGSLAVNDDGVSGTIDAAFVRDAADASTLHVKGNWTCGGIHAFATAAASVPCGQYYTDGGLTSDQIAALQGHCLPQQLQLGGTLHFGVTAAIDDSSHPGRPIDDPPANLCGVYGKSYYATLAFTHQRDTFELAFAVRGLSPLTDPDLKPGTFELSKGVYDSPNVFAVMVVADPTAQGPAPAGGVASYQWGGQAGSFTVNPDLKSGSADLWLGGGNQFEDRIHVSGQWRCA